jgi:hypothetical protein
MAVRDEGSGLCRRSERESNPDGNGDYFFDDPVHELMGLLNDELKTIQSKRELAV